MGTIKHPEDETLIAFFENPSAHEFKDLSLHLATCQSCRNQMSALSKLKETLSEIATTSGMDHSDATMDTDDVFTKNQTHAQNLKAALHFESHRAAMDRSLSEYTEIPEKQQETVKQDASKKPGFAGLIRKCLRLRTPFWLTAPAAGFAAIIFIFLFSPAFSPEVERLSIAAYQDNAVIEFQSKTARPGIGFFENARTNEKSFENINISLIKNTDIALSWPPVENAIDYTLTLKMIQGGEKKGVDKITTNETHAVFQKNALEKNTRYEWRLSGQTRDDLIFQASGGFVITQTKH
ncbi:MAG: hypothetical protein VST69_02135 [Nitrospirota bacterium]|nr:hypothetical protein [Nitrospirota bacterium]